MLKNYFVVAIRALKRQKGYAAINVAGLALGLACCVLLVLYVRSERAVDADIPEADRIYRVGSAWAEGEAGLPLTAPAPIGAEMVEAFAEVEVAARLWAGWLNVRDGAAAQASPPVFRRNAYVTDPDLFTLFGWQLLHGDAATALDAPRSVVLHEDFARTVFGTAEAVGRQLLVETFNNGTQPYTVTGVWADRPYNSLTHFNGEHYPLVASFTPGDMLTEGAWTGWNNRYLLHYVRLAADADPDALQRRLPAFVQARAPEAWRDAYTARLEPFSRLYLDDSDGRNRKAVQLLAVLAALVLLVACINFANLSTVRALNRAKEIGVRKAVGAYRMQLVGQLLSEALLVTAIATALGAALAWALHRPFFDLAGKPLVLAQPWGWNMLLSLAGIAGLTGVLAGAYPAFVLSGFRPVQALRGTVRAGRGHHRLRRGLVVVQFAAAVALVAGAAIIQQQTAFLNRADVGFDREHVLAVRSVPRDWSAEGVARLQPLKAALEAVPGVRAVSLSWETAAEGAHNTFAVRRAGQPETDAQALPRFVVDADYDDVYRLDVVAGAFFADDEPAEGLVLNEQAAQALGGVQPGDLLALGDQEIRVRGIVRDFHFESLHETIKPLVIAPLDQVPLYRAFSIRLSGRNVAETLAAVQDAWQSVLPSAPFEYTFVEDDLARFYTTERRTATVVGFAAGLAVVVALLGLFGLVSLAVFQRRKEIGVRKVLGADVPSILVLFGREFGGLVLVGAAVAAPLVYWGAARWLDGFAYRVGIGPLPFVLAGGLLLVIALVTVSTHVYRAATANPARALRSE